MREIKFRHIKPDGSVEFEQLNREMSGGYIEQYTGLKDKNGKEIYEGDIVEKCYNKAKKLYSSAPVEFKHGKFESGGWTLCKFAHRGEVIGNIHENKELLK